MKTKELIRLLQEEDPSGELECCVGNADILCVDSQPAYWDGSLQVLVRDESLSPYYNVVGARYVSSGTKVVISPHSISDAISENPDLPVEYDGSEDRRARYKAANDEWRETIRGVMQDVDRQFFVRYMQKRLCAQHGEDFDEEEVARAAESFFDEHLSWEDPIPADINSWDHGSIADRREKQWARQVSVDFDGGKLVLRIIGPTAQ